MNFLNKKYTSLHASSPYGHSNSRSFLPAASTVRDSAPSLSSGACQTHPSQQVRHLCLECVELLCAECIGEHLQLHREANLIPKISSVKQMRTEMENKLEHISMAIAKHSPQHTDLDALRRRALERVDEMRKDLVKAVDQWVGIMRAHLLGSLGFDQLARTRAEMDKLTQEIGMLKGALQTGTNPVAIKKVFQIDAQKLEEGYAGMYARFQELQRKAEFDFAIDWKQIVQSLETHINIRNRTETPQQNNYQYRQELPLEQAPSRGGSNSSKSDRAYDLHE